MGGLAQNVQKPPPGKNVQKSQGQIFQECVECQEFQECQGQISQGQIFQECQGQMPRSIISGMPRSNGKPEKTGKMGNGKMGKCNKNKKPKTLKEILILY